MRAASLKKQQLREGRSSGSRQIGDGSQKKQKKSLYSASFRGKKKNASGAKRVVGAGVRNGAKWTSYTGGGLGNGEKKEAPIGGANQVERQSPHQNLSASSRREIDHLIEEKEEDK